MSSFIDRLLGRSDRRRIRELEHKVDLLEKESRASIPEYIFEPEVKIREPKWNYEAILMLAKTSPTLRMIFRAIQQEVTSPRWDIEARFVKKCTRCGAEFDTEVETCKKCGGRVRDPSDLQAQRLRKLLENPNKSYTWADIMRGAVWYGESCDDWWLSIAYRYITMPKGEVLREPAEVYAEDPRYMRVVADEHGNIGNKEYFCPVCYKADDFHTLEELPKYDGKCPNCGTELVQTCYVQEIAGNIKARFTEDEIVHGSSNRVPPELYGNPKIIAIYKILFTIANMDDYNYEVYSEGKLGSIINFPGSKQKDVQRLRRSIERSIKKKDWQDITTGIRKASKKIRQLFLASQQPITRIEMMENMQALQSLEFYKLYREIACFSPRTRILTEHGWKSICKVEVGEKVLTHLGNWKRVIRKFKRPYSSETLRIKVGGCVEKYRTIEITPTPEHPILTTKGWVQAKNLKIEDEIALIGSFCRACGKPITIGSQYCSTECLNSMREYDKIRKPIFEHTSITPEERGLILERDGYRCQAPRCRSTDKLEIHHILPIGIDHSNRPENRITLCHSCHQKESVIIPLAIKRLSELGKLYLYNSVFEHGFYSKLFRPITEIERKQRKRTLPVYNLEVEDDESYIANSVIVHNCAVYGVTPVFVSIIESGRAGNNPRMQIDVQNRTTREGQSNIEDTINYQLLPIFQITDWEFRFNEIEQKDELREAEIERTKAFTAATYLDAGFEVEIDEHGELKVSGKGSPRTQQQPGQPEGPGRPPPLPEVSSASEAILETQRMAQIDQRMRDEQERNRRLAEQNQERMR